MRDPFTIRVLAWLAAALFAALAFVYLGVAFQRSVVEGWFEGKLAFFGLVIAGATFQYSRLA